MELRRRVIKLEAQRRIDKSQIIICATDERRGVVSIFCGTRQLFTGSVEEGEKYLASLPEEACVAKFVGHPEWCL